MAYCEVEPGVRLYYEQFGAGSPVVFIHGGGMSHEIWEQQVFDLADDFHTITLDLRGHGQSDKPAHGHTIQRFLNDVEILLDHVGILYALNDSQSTRRLVVVNSGPRFVGGDEIRGDFSTNLWDTHMNDIAKNKIEARTNLVAQTFFHNDPGQSTRQAVINIMLQWPIYAEKMLGRDLQHLDLESQLDSIKTPTLILHGIHDKKQRYSGARRLASTIAGSHLIPFENSGHNPQLEEVEKFNCVLRKFFE